MNIPDKTEVLEALSVTNLTGPAATLADAVRALAKEVLEENGGAAYGLARAITEDYDAETE